MMSEKTTRWYDRSWPLWVSGLLLAVLGSTVTLAFRAGGAMTTLEQVKVDNSTIKGELVELKSSVDTIKGVLIGEKQKVADAETVHRGD